LPAHLTDRFDVLAIDEDIAIAERLQQGDELHREPHLGRPKALKLRTPQQMAGDVEPARQVLTPVGLRDEWQHRVEVPRPQNLEQGQILEVPQQRATIDDAIDPPLEGRVGQRLQQGSRQRQMDAGEFLASPETARDAIEGKQDLTGLPVLVFQQVLEIAQGLVEIQHERVMDCCHESSTMTAWDDGQGYQSRTSGFTNESMVFNRTPSIIDMR